MFDTKNWYLDIELINDVDIFQKRWYFFIKRQISTDNLSVHVKQKRSFQDQKDYKVITYTTFERIILVTKNLSD